MKRRDIERILKDNGFQLVRVNKHIIYQKDNITVALPSRLDYTRGLTRRVLQHAMLPKDLIKEIV